MKMQSELKRLIQKASKNKSGSSKKAFSDGSMLIVEFYFSGSTVPTFLLMESDGSETELFGENSVLIVLEARS